jgi:hypothetical protein
VTSRGLIYIDWYGVKRELDAQRARAEARRAVEHVGVRIRDALDPIHGALAFGDTHLSALGPAGEDGIVDSSEEAAPAGP